MTREQALDVLVTEIRDLASRLPPSGAFEHHCRLLLEQSQLGLSSKIRLRMAKGAVVHLQQIRLRREGAWGDSELAALVDAAYLIGGLYPASRGSAVYAMLRECLFSRLAGAKQGVASDKD